MKVLAKLGAPNSVVNYVRALYNDSKCKICTLGKVSEGFEVTSGVRQGCPLSPFLFVISVDILLRKLCRALPDSCIRAFADDIGTVVVDWWRSQKEIFNIFEEFRGFSGLELSIPKTALIRFVKRRTPVSRTRLQKSPPGGWA